MTASRLYFSQYDLSVRSNIIFHYSETPRSSSVQSPDVAVPISAVSHTIFDDPATPNNFDDLGEILDAELLDQNWFTSQDFGVDDWMLHLA